MAFALAHWRSSVPFLETCGDWIIVIKRILGKGIESSGETRNYVKLVVARRAIDINDRVERSVQKYA